MMSPDVASSAAPTLNLEYGDTEPSRAFAAARINLFLLCIWSDGRFIFIKIYAEMLQVRQSFGVKRIERLPQIEIGIKIKLGTNHALNVRGTVQGDAQARPRPVEFRHPAFHRTIREHRRAQGNDSGISAQKILQPADIFLPLQCGANLPR